MKLCRKYVWSSSLIEDLWNVEDTCLHASTLSKLSEINKLKASGTRSRLYLRQMYMKNLFSIFFLQLKALACSVKSKRTASNKVVILSIDSNIMSTRTRAGQKEVLHIVEVIFLLLIYFFKGIRSQADPTQIIWTNTFLSQPWREGAITSDQSG